MRAVLCLSSLGNAWRLRGRGWMSTPLHAPSALVHQQQSDAEYQEQARDQREAEGEGEDHRAKAVCSRRRGWRWHGWRC